MIKEYLPTVIAVTAIIFLWQFSTSVFDIPAYLIPKPLDIGRSLYFGLATGRLWPDIAATLTGMLGGYLIGCPLGLLAAALLSEFKIWERAFYPLLVALQSIPKVALAPVIIVWFGFGIESKVVLVALMCFFPTFINGFAGLKSYNRDLADMFRAFGAHRWRIFGEVKAPSAIRHVFAGLQISIVLALLGTVLSEMVAARRGLGYVIQSSSTTFDIPMMFACTVILAFIGVTFTRLLLAAQYALIFWERDANAN